MKAAVRQLSGGVTNVIRRSHQPRGIPGKAGTDLGYEAMVAVGAGGLARAERAA